MAALAALAPAARAADAPLWRLEQPAPPPGAPFKVPLGKPGDLRFWDRSHGLLSIEGNSTIPRGLYAWNGESWHQLATVCGGPGDTSRIAFAGPNEWWTVSEPSRPRIGNGTALCHFKDGVVVGSYSTPFEASDPIQQMDSAACNGPSDCWFGGFDSRTPNGARKGAFHIHWDGSTLKTVYAPFGRGISDIQFQGGVFYETSLLGTRPENTTDPLDPPDSASTPALIHKLAGSTFTADPFTPSQQPSGSELLALDGDGSELWAVGGGAASGTSTPSGTSIATPPLAARLSGGSFSEVPVDPALFGTNDRFGDVAVVPGTTTAYAAVQPFASRASTTARAKVAQMTPAGVTQVSTLPASGSGRGTAARVAFSAPNDGWMVTQAGWLFHYTDGTRPQRNDDPAWQGTITFRPNEAASQFVPDTPPDDDANFFAPPPAEVPPPPPPRQGKRIPALLKNVRVKVRGTTLVVSFKLVRKARVQLVAKRKGRVVAKSKARKLRPGNRQLKLKLQRKRWPTRLQFKTHEPGQRSASDDDGTVTT